MVIIFYNNSNFKLQYFNIKLNLNRYKVYQDLTKNAVQLIQLLEGALSCFEMLGDVFFFFF